NAPRVRDLAWIDYQCGEADRQRPRTGSRGRPGDRRCRRGAAAQISGDRRCKRDPVPDVPATIPSIVAACELTTPMTSHLSIHALGAPLRALARNKTGGALATFGLVTPVLLMGIAAAVDYGMFEQGRGRLQAQVDAAAIAAAREMQMAQTDSTRI